MLFLAFIAEKYLVFESLVGTGFGKPKDKKLRGQEHILSAVPEVYKFQKYQNQNQGHISKPNGKAIWSCVCLYKSGVRTICTCVRFKD